jgi:hypothetical protein
MTQIKEIKKHIYDSKQLITACHNTRVLCYYYVSFYQKWTNNS